MHDRYIDIDSFGSLVFNGFEYRTRGMLRIVKFHRIELLLDG